MRDVGKVNTLLEPPTDEYEEGYTEKHDMRPSGSGVLQHHINNERLALHGPSTIEQPDHRLPLTYIRPYANVVYYSVLRMMENEMAIFLFEQSTESTSEGQGLAGARAAGRKQIAN